MKDKIVLITGSSVGIGMETAFSFSKENSKIIITYNKSKKEAIQTEEKCKQLGASETILIKLDVKDIKSINEAYKEVTKRYKHIDILVNNAGVISWKPLKEQTLEEIKDQINTNLLGLINMTKLFLPIIKDSIINISSGAGKTGYPSLSTYCATKFGVRGFTQSLSGELKKIKVYSVNPGMTKTRMTNFSGILASKVGDIVLETAKTGYNKPSGSDIDVWEYA